MKAGFAKVDITPRLGVELAGFGPYLHRCARDVRDRLSGRALAVSDGARRWVLVAADLIGFDAGTTGQVRRILADRHGLSTEQVMLHATHTHSAPAVVRGMIGWGEPDQPYLERLPWLLAQAAGEALDRLQEVEFSFARVPVEGIGYNRELEPRPAYEEALRPARPKVTDTDGWVVRADAAGEMVGFLSHFSCHPVVCCEATHSIHGDYCGVAMSRLEAENPGAVGLFVQGGHGDLNTCVCHMPQAESIRALEVISERFARSVRRGIAQAGPLGGSSVSAALHRVTFSRRPVTADQLRAEIEQHRQTVRDNPEGDGGRECRLADVFLTAARRMLRRVEAGESLEVPADVQAFRLGDLVMIGTPFELFRGVKESVGRAIAHEPLMVLSTTNDYLGYAPTRQMYDRNDAAHYAREIVPRIVGCAAFGEDLEEEIVCACRALAAEVSRGRRTRRGDYS